MAVYTVLYYWFISKYWIPINVFGAFLTLVSAVGVWFLPESPKFYLSKKRYDEARAAITFIAKVNNQNAFNGKFDREILDEHHRKESGLNASKISTGPNEIIYKKPNGLDTAENQTNDED